MEIQSAVTSPVSGAGSCKRGPVPWQVYPLGLGAAVAALYLLTMPSGVGGAAGSAEWQFMGKVWGVSQAPGHPLYIMLSHFFFLLPFGDPAWRVNLMSAVFAVATVVVVQRILAGLLKSEMIACGGALLLAVSQIFWTAGVVAGVYSLDAFFVSMVIYLIFKWVDMRRDGKEASEIWGRAASRRGNGFLYAACILYLVSLGNQLTMLALLPALVFIVLKADWRAAFNVRMILCVVAGLVVLAGLYGLLIVFTSLPSPYLETRIGSLDDLVRFVLGADFFTRMFAGGARGLLAAQLPLYIKSLSAQFSVLSFVMITAGLFLLASHHGLKVRFLVIYLVVDFVLTGQYAVDVVLSGQKAFYVIPSCVALAIIMGFAVGVFQVSGRLGGSARTAGSAACLAVLGAIVVNLVFANAPEMLEGQALAGTRSVFSNDVVDKLPHGGVILAYDRENTALFFYRMLGEGYGSGKEWRVLQYSCWKHEKTDKRGIDPANDAATYDVSEVSRLLKGEAVEWGPLTTEDTRAGRHEAFFFHRDKAIMDMAGFISEPVDLKGDGDGKNRYGGAAVRLYRIVGTVKGKKPEEIIRTYDEGLSLLRRGAIEEARKIFQSLLDECNPDFAEAQFQVGMSYRGMRNYEEARRRWKIVLDLIPGYPPALDALQSLPLPRGQSIAEAGSHSVE